MTPELIAEIESIIKSCAANYATIDNYKERLNWYHICRYCKLSEAFIHEHKDLVVWSYISAYQKLSETFIHKHIDLVDWRMIGMYQKLSEIFIVEHSALVFWKCIVRYQKLSETFISKLPLDKVDLNYICRYQKMPDEFFNKHMLTKPKNNFLYYTREQKLALIPPRYVIDGDYIIAYKGIRSDRYSCYNFQFQYLPSETYECHADHNNTNRDSFGFSVGTFKSSKAYSSELVITVKIHIDDLAAVINRDKKLRCSKFTVLN